MTPSPGEQGGSISPIEVVDQQEGQCLPPDERAALAGALGGALEDDLLRNGTMNPPQQLEFNGSPLLHPPPHEALLPLHGGLAPSGVSSSKESLIVIDINILVYYSYSIAQPT